MKNIESKSLQEILSHQLEGCVRHNRRDCKSLSDHDFLMLCIERVIKFTESGRSLLQKKSDLGDQQIARSTFFDAVKSSRRLDFMKESSLMYWKYLNEKLSKAGVNYLKEFPELDGYDIFSCDGHYTEHSSHTPKDKIKNKKYAAGNLFIQNLRTGLINNFACVSDGSSKNHEMPIFKIAIENYHKKRTVWVADRGFIDYGWWLGQAKKKQHVVSRVRGKNPSVLFCSENHVDTLDPVNTGVTRDRTGGFSSASHPIRIIEYTDPETNEKYVFYTTLKNMRPGVICRLYFLRWQIEKAFDSFKNSYHEKKAWASGKNAITSQGCAISIVYNFHRFIYETMKNDHGTSDKKAEQKYEKSLETREVKANKKGFFLHPLLYIKNRLARLSSQFIRAIRNHFSRKITFIELVPLFIRRLESYL